VELRAIQTKLDAALVRRPGRDDLAKGEGGIRRRVWVVIRPREPPVDHLDRRRVELMPQPESAERRARVWPFEREPER
jgi:hypothetical protein